MGLKQHRPNVCTNIIAHILLLVKFVKAVYKKVNVCYDNCKEHYAHDFIDEVSL